MSKRAGGAVLRMVRSAAVAAEVTDQRLLSRFIEGDETAFAALVKRHAGMVLGVCRRVLPTVQDAEDASQAVFLVLARKAKLGQWKPSIANWLYTTARQIALKASRTALRRANRESQATSPVTASVLDQMSGREAFAALDEELDRLPVIYREPLVLCYLQELSREEAAARLGIPPMTLKSQLERGRKRLGDALTKRGIVLGASLLAVSATSSAWAAPRQLVDSILAAVGGSPSPTVVALAQGVVMNGVLSGTKLVIVLAACVAVIGFGFTYMPIAAEPQKPANKMEKPAATANAKGGDISKTEARERNITGKVVGTDGKPLVADLSLVWQDGKPQPLGRTKEDGTFAVTVPFQRAEYGGWLVATAAGHGMDFHPHGMEYLPQSMTPTAEVTLKLPKERPIKGRILDQQGKPVVGATVVASGFSAFDSDVSTDGHLMKWATEGFRFGSPPGGDRGMYYTHRPVAAGDPEGRSPYAASTDKDGRFVISGTGSGHLVTLRLRGAGVADKEIVTLNRDGFDPNPVNKAARDNEIKGYSFGGKWVLNGPDPTVVLEPEKLIRGRVTDHDGKPRAGVKVTFTRPNKRDLNPDYNQAVTDKDGRYEIRGARKHKGYMVEIPPDPDCGLLQCQGFADDTVGYEPIIIDLKCAKGVVVSGTVTNKSTGKPVAAQFYWDVLANNPFVDKYPPFQFAASMGSEVNRTDAQGRFRVVTIQGPVIMMGGPSKGDGGGFRPAVPDPKHPDRFHASEGTLLFDHYGGGQAHVQGCWCKVLDAKAGATELTVDVELEPATKILVRVVAEDGTPVTGTKATGVTQKEFAHPTSFPETDTLTVFNLDPKRERLLAVVHEKRSLVGTLMLTGDDKNPIVKLGAGGNVTGRTVDKAGKPIAGLSVHLGFERREVLEASNALRKVESVETDANGEFRIDRLFPGQQFYLSFHRGQKRFGPDYDKTPRHTIAKHGDMLKLGDLKLEPTNTDGEK